LMKATQPVSDLVSADRRLFVLSSEQTARLDSLMTSTARASTT